MFSSAAETHEQLTINELSRVHEELISVASKWKFFGGNIGVLPAELSNIEKSNADFDEKLYKVLEYRLKQVPLLTWPDIVRALRSPAVHEHDLASQIGSKYSQLHTPLSVMATGVGPPEVPSDQGTRELEKDDLKVVFDALLPVAGKYVFFGIQIGVDMNEIDEIRKQFMNDTRECLLRILRIRLGRTPTLTWKDIDTALRSKAVDESRLANTLMQEYGHLFSHKQTFESQEDGRKGSEKKHKPTKKGKYVGEDRSQQVGKERETDSDEEVSESEEFRNLSETPHTYDKSTKTQRKVKKAKRLLEPEKGSERERKQRGDKKKHADISPKSESKVAKNSRERLKGSRQKCKEISEQRAPKEVLMKYESEPSSGKYERKVICKRQDRLKRSEVNSKRYTLKEVQAKSESESSASSIEEEMIEVDEFETAEEYSSEQEQYSDNEEVAK